MCFSLFFSFLWLLACTSILFKRSLGNHAFHIFCSLLLVEADVGVALGVEGEGNEDVADDGSDDPYDGRPVSGGA